MDVLFGKRSLGIDVFYICSGVREVSEYGGGPGGKK